MGSASFSIASKRIGQILKLQDILEEISPKIKRTCKCVKPVIFNNFSSFWNKNSAVPCLDNINVTIKPGQITTVIGKIGSGKTSFLLSFLKMMPITCGTLESYGKIAYVEQDPIIFAGSIRDNIVFGNEFDEKLYQKVLEGCNLKEDLEKFPNKDLTEIGEKGSNISGGQRARLSLARALYSQSDIYLLDDPFSALDGKVARDIFQNALKSDLVKDKIIILATHHLQFARESDYIILMDQGRIEAQGIFQDLESLKLNLLSIFPTTGDHEKAKAVGTERIDKKTENSLGQRGLVAEKEALEEENFEVTSATYKAYFRTKGSLLLFFIFTLAFITPEALAIYLMLLIGNWASQQHQFLIENPTALIKSFDNSFYITMAWSVLLLIFITNFAKVFKANEYLVLTHTELHKKMLEAVTRARTLFFDINPIGKILDRFSGDLTNLEAGNQKNLVDFLEGAVGHLCLLVTVCFINPLVIIPGILALFLLYYTTIFFRKPMVLSAKLIILSRSPLDSFVSTTLQGLIGIRVYQQGGRFVREFLELVYLNMKACIFNAKVVRLLSFILNLIIQFLTLFGIWAFVILIFYTTCKQACWE